jgi:hypothetical protein
MHFRHFALCSAAILLSSFSAPAQTIATRTLSVNDEHELVGYSTWEDLVEANASAALQAIEDGGVSAFALTLLDDAGQLAMLGTLGIPFSSIPFGSWADGTFAVWFEGAFAAFTPGEVGAALLNAGDASSALSALDLTDFSASLKLGLLQVDDDGTGGGNFEVGTNGDGYARDFRFRQVRLGEGTDAAPSLTFNSDTDTGFYRFGTDIFAAVAGGSFSASFSSSGIETTNLTTGTLDVNGAMGVSDGGALTAVSVSSDNIQLGGYPVANHYGESVLVGADNYPITPQAAFSTYVIQSNDEPADRTLDVAPGLFVGQRVLFVPYSGQDPAEGFEVAGYDVTGPDGHIEFVWRDDSWQMLTWTAGAL